MFDNLTSREFIISFFKSPTKKKLLGNFFSLSFLQMTEYVFPLITFPYLVRVLGPANYGFIAFAGALVGYFQILTDYGFNLSATRDISINSENKKKISEIFCSVMLIKIILGTISFFILAVIIFIFPKFHNSWIIYIYTFGVVIGSILFPVWFFQGMEKMKFITILNVISKLIFIFGIFIFIREASDFVLVPLLISIGSIIAGIISIIIIFTKFKIRLIIPTFSLIKYQLVEGWYVFISTIAISLYTISNTFILGIFTNNTIVGYYSAAEKIVRAVQGILNPISQAAYPYFSKLYIKDKLVAAINLKKLLYIIGLFTLFISILVSIFSPLICRIFLGPDFFDSILILRILIFIVFAIGMNNILGIQGLIAFGFKKEFTRVIVIFSIIHIILLFILILSLKSTGVAIATLITECLISISQYYILKKKKILI